MIDPVGPVDPVDPADPADPVDPVDRAERIVSGEAWDELVARIGALRELVYGGEGPGDTHTRAEGVRYLLRFLAAGINVCIEHDDTDTPELGRMTENRMSWGLDNPDCLYSYTRLAGDGTYRIAGQAGSACHLELQVNTGHFGDGDFTGWQAVSALGRDELVVDADGNFEVTLSAARPPGAANWLHLDDSASFLLLRQYFADWARETPADVVIERLDLGLPPPVLTAERMHDQLDLLGQWLDVGSRCWAEISRAIMAGEPGAVTPFRPPASASGLKGQAYGFGPFRCEADEAVILHFEPPAARLWGLSLCDPYWQSIDFAAHQSSLNSAQASLGPDGTFVGVISHDDPGVANWLDPAGWARGTLAVRYLFAAGDLDSDLDNDLGGADLGDPDLPAVSFTTVARTDLDAALPVDVPRVDAATRASTLRDRRNAVTRRYRR